MCVLSVPDKGGKAILNLCGKKTRTLTTTQAYSALYYKSEIRAVAMERWNQKLKEEAEMEMGDKLGVRLPRCAPLWF
jgi:hypothetical protein